MANAEPFLIHLTVFKSRLGLANIVLPFCSLAHQPTATLTRKVSRVIEAREELSTSAEVNFPVFRYLLDKNMVGEKPRQSGRYKEYTLVDDGENWVATRSGKTVEHVLVYRTDMWMCHPDVDSTIGVPTPENVDELLELCLQLRLITRSKNTLTTAGLLVQTLRKALPDQGNPFLLGVETIALLRQIIETDGLLIRELIRELGGKTQVSRDELAREFPQIVDRTLATVKTIVSPTIYRKARDFSKLIDPNRKNRQQKRFQSKSKSTSKGPGVTEHRLSPRLEWLVDLGYLSKDGLAKNTFSYVVTSSIANLLCQLDANVQRFNTDWASCVAIGQWFSCDCWDSLRNLLPKLESPSCLFSAYARLKRPIGPSPISDVAFLAALMSDRSRPYEQFVEDIVQLPKIHSGISLSGGRYQRTPENVFIPDELLEGHI